MCGNLYICSEHDIPVWPWMNSESPDGISVQKVAEPDSAIRKLFSKPFVYAVSSNLTSDACGFRFIGKNGDKTREALVHFLERVLLNSGEVELFEWSHDNPNAVPGGRDWFGPSDLLSWHPFVSPDELVIIVNES